MLQEQLWCRRFWVDLYSGLVSSRRCFEGAAALRCVTWGDSGAAVSGLIRREERLDAAGYTDLSRVYRTEILAGGNNIFHGSHKL